jgi:AraC-like DNA-binding protein
MLKTTAAFNHNFYLILLRYGQSLQCGYGGESYDFQEGTMAFLAPHQLLSWHSDEPLSDLSGYQLAFHPDFVGHHPVAGRLKGSTFFSYAIHEALHLSFAERGLVSDLFEKMLNEYTGRCDRFSQSVLIGYLELMLSYADRFYHRQFLTRSQADRGLLVRFEQALQTSFSPEQLGRHGLPTVQRLAGELHLSPGYLSDMIKSRTGKSAQEHIHLYLLEAAKALLAASDLSVAQTAYQLGFEYSQYFSRLFRRKTGLSPSQFRASVRNG